MKKNPTRGGVRIYLRALLYLFAFIALMGVRETITDGRGPVSDSLGRTFNNVLMATSKIGLGMAMMNQDKPGENTLIGRYSRQLGVASHRAFVSSAKVNLYAREDR